jgi:hypothetical protein
MLLPLRFRGVAVATLLSLVGNCNWVSSGSTTVVRASTLMTGKSSLACVLAGENAATVRTVPSEAGTASEMWQAGCTSYNTGLTRFSPQPPVVFFKVDG